KTTTWNVGALVIQNQLLNLHFLFPLFFPQGFPKLITTHKYTKYFQSEKYLINFLKRNQLKY
ncbi:hypothetical protein PG649_08670, partial [Riemerella anatipestifer]|nr:hypothetical protein [Riemerella anatipestifer]